MRLNVERIHRGRLLHSGRLQVLVPLVGAGSSVEANMGWRELAALERSLSRGRKSSGA